MGTPSERIQRLREETVPERWTIYNDMVCAEVDGCTCGAGHEAFPHEPGCGLDRPVATVEHDENRQRIARWDPQAAARALDLLSAVLGDHGATRTPGCGPICAEAWALLDTIDPEGADK